MSDLPRVKQASQPLPHVAALMLAVAFLFLATGCGKKPGAVDPPPYVEDDTFPRTYPDLATDPKP